MKNTTSWLLAILSGVLMGISWPETGGFTPLVFIGLIPLFFMERMLSESKTAYLKLKIFGGAYVAFLLFNFITTWWIQYASLPGMIMAELFNSLFMAGIFLLFHEARRKLGNRAGYFAFVIFWLAFEWVHYNWELSWVWLTLGNVFASTTKWVQWYEYTGVLGGSFWVLLVNVLLFKWLYRIIKQEEGRFRPALQFIPVLLLILLPILFSLRMFKHYEEEKEPVEIVVVQPNIDPYHEKFYGMSESDQIDLLVKLAEEKTDTNTDFVVFPETAFPMGYWEHELDYIYGVEQLRLLLRRYPQLRIVTGLSSMRLYAPGEVRSLTARTFKNDSSGNAYDYYNTAMQLDRGPDIQLYHKSKLVLGVEKMPFGTLLKPLEGLAINLGGASGSLGYETEPFNFTSTGPGTDPREVAPVICYESVYGEYVGEYVQKGAGLIFIITNDGWWEDTPGYRQHLAYAKLRAIETRRSIARSANTGISAFINQRGEILQPTGWWERLSIKGTINASDKLTFYVQYGDYLGRVAAFFAILLLVWILVRRLNKKNELVL